ncbi:hypothetical protein RSAG8_02605, partial [Rhizoctonia solani AG-8 WAC10335]
MLVPDSTLLMLPTLRNDQPTTRETESHGAALHTRAPATQAGFSSHAVPEDFPPIKSNNGWETCSFTPRRKPAANTDYDSLTEAGSGREYLRRRIGFSWDGKSPKSSSKGTPPIEMVGPDLVGFSRSFLEGGESAAPIASATPSSCSSPPTNPPCSEIHRKRHQADDTDQPESIRLLPKMHPAM